MATPKSSMLVLMKCFPATKSGSYLRHRQHATVKRLLKSNQGQTHHSKVLRRRCVAACQPPTRTASRPANMMRLNKAA